MVDLAPTLPGLLEQGAGRLRIFSGYSFSLPAGVRALSAGIVAGPRWVANTLREYPEKPVVLDNGAFPAWVRGESLDLNDHLAAVVRGARVLDDAGALESVIAPDIVGGGLTSWRRTLHSIEHLAGYHLLLPLQEGIPVEEAVSVARVERCGLFIGGKSMRWKVETARKISGRVYTHVGRVSRDGHLWTFSQIADAVDSTTWTRAQNWNRTKDWAGILSKYAEV